MCMCVHFCLSDGGRNKIFFHGQSTNKKFLQHISPLSRTPTLPFPLLSPYSYFFSSSHKYTTASTHANVIPVGLFKCGLNVFSRRFETTSDRQREREREKKYIRKKYVLYFFINHFTNSPLVRPQLLRCCCHCCTTTVFPKKW